MRVAAVLLTTGERDDQLVAALDSIRSQRDVDTDLLVVLNRDPDESRVAADDADAWQARLGADVEVLRPGRNLGIPAGRNVGLAAVRDRADVVLFLDDDARLDGDRVLASAVAAFRDDPDLAVVSMRLVDPDTGRTERRHVPRLRVGDAARSSWVTSFLGGASVVRVQAFDRAGGYPDDFVYALEETSLAWRMIDHGYRLRYRGDLHVLHPAAPASRHADFHRLTSRNRVLVAHLHLPFVLAAVYLPVWTAISLVRAPGALRAVFGGIADGLRLRHLPRQPISWRTVWRMTRLGRPPVI